MANKVDFKEVSFSGLESSPFAHTLAGLRANEVRYFKNKYNFYFMVSPANESKDILLWVNRILTEERGIEIAS